MSLSSFFSTYKYTLRKIFGVALMVYLALMVKIEGIGETDEVVQFDYFVDTHGAAVPEFCQMYQNEKKQQSPLHLLLEELCQDYKPEGESGFSAPETSFTRLCEKSSVLCEKTTFNGNFSTEEKADYFGQVKRLVEDIDSTAKRGTALEQVFTQILINQLKGERR
ncbi:MAG: hypothetical protein LBP53_05615 [Candidatus Peribacteria bacterium]|jgi:hypothetical protein|nr:hypothetical protein [Candidatus Peribacteria bacterium]